MIDTTNPCTPERDGLVDLGEHTAARFVSGRLPGARYVKAFNTLTSGFLADSAGRTGDDRVVVFLSGDDPDAKATAATLVQAAGFAPPGTRRPLRRRGIPPHRRPHTRTTVTSPKTPRTKREHAMPTPTVLVFGATGAIGGALINRLLPDHTVGRIRLVATARTTTSATKLEQRGIECRRIDLDHAERDGLDPVLDTVRGVDRVFLLTSYAVTMLAQSKAVIDASKQVGVSHVVHLGAHASPDTTILHLGWHQLIEEYLSGSGLNFTNLQPTTLMQNIMMLWSIGGSPTGVLPHYIGDTATSWVDSDDVADAAASILRDPEPHSGRSYLLGAEVASMPEIAEAMTAVTGRPWRAEAREPEEFFQAVTATGGDPIYMACVRTIFERTRQGTLPDLAETSDALTQLTGRPATSIRSFLEKHREHFMAADQHG